MDFHEINMKGPFYIEKVTSLPASNDEQRLIYYDGDIYYNDGTEWLTLINDAVISSSPDSEFVKIDVSNLTSDQKVTFLDNVDVLGYLGDSTLTMDQLKGIFDAWLKDSAAPLLINNNFSEFTTTEDSYKTELSPYEYSGKPNFEAAQLTKQLTARTNLGLGTISTYDEDDYAVANHTHSNLDSLEIDSYDDIKIIVNVWLKDGATPLLANNNFSEFTTTTDVYRTELDPYSYSGKPTTETQQNNRQLLARTNLGLGNNSTVTYTVSDSDPSLGNNGDIWYIPTV